MSSYTEIIGVDPGLRCPAFAAVDAILGSKWDVLRSACFQDAVAHDTALDACFRAHHIAGVILKQVATVPGPKVLCVEGPSYGSYMRTSSMEQLARCRQALYDSAAFYLEDFLFFEIAPSNAKRVVTGKGNAGKNEVADVLEQKLGVNLPTKPIEKRGALADAIAVAFAGKKRYELEVTR